MKKWCLFVFLCVNIFFSAAQETIVLNVDGRKFQLSELEWLYQHSDQTGTFREFMNDFIEARLKVQDAVRQGLDTVATFRKERADYAQRVLYQRMTGQEPQPAFPEEECLRILHFVKPLRQTLSRASIREAEEGMNALYRMLKDTETVEDIQKIEKEFSVTGREEWIGRLDFPLEVENRIFSLSPEEISEPFFSPLGIHIVQLLDRRSTKDTEAEVRRHTFLRQWRENKTEELKKKYAFSLNEDGIGDLFLNGHTSQVLFRYKGKSYTGAEFARFQAGSPYALRKQLELFTAHTLLSDEAESLLKEDLSYQMELLTYSDNLLIQAITEKRIGPFSEDTDALQAYFQAHRSRYTWELPRFRGVVLHTPTKKMSREVKKFLKKLPENEWEEALALTFNGELAPRIRFEQGEYTIGENAYVDKIIFKQGNFLPDEKYPFTTVVGKKMSGPEDWQRVKEQVIRDHTRELEINWLKDLRKKMVVEINEEVLKTVNNH